MMDRKQTFAISLLQNVYIVVWFCCKQIELYFPLFQIMIMSMKHLVKHLNDKNERKKFNTTFR